VEVTHFKISQVSQDTWADQLRHVIHPFVFKTKQASLHAWISGRHKGGWKILQMYFSESKT
jgi:hypothetical protein